MNAATASLQPFGSSAPLITRRVDYIDALRGAACFWVLLHHTFATLGPVQGAGHYPFLILSTIARAGWLGVSLFLVLSGFCLYLPMVRKNPISNIKLDVANFALRRAWRILPPFYVAYFGLAVLQTIVHYKKFHHLDLSIWHWPGGVILHVLMLFNLSASTVANINAAFWSIALESQLYVIFPLLVWAYAKYGLTKPLISVFAITVVWQLYCFHKFGFTLTWTPLLSVWWHALPARCFEFALGMATAAFCARPVVGQQRIAAALVVILVIPALWFVLCVSRFAPFIDQTWGIIFASTLILLSAIPDSKFAGNALGRAFVQLGTISYSVYLLHEPLIRVVTPAIMHIHEPYIAGIVRIPILIAVGYGFHRVIERPFMRLSSNSRRAIEIAAADNPAP